MTDLKVFVTESNRIESITRAPTPDEISAHERFLALGSFSIPDLETFVRVCARAVLRRSPGMDIRIGSHYPPMGGLGVVEALDDIIHRANFMLTGQYEIHREYESLHPFTDGNGRSGRVIWLWMMNKRGGAPLGFLHQWYYQSLEGSR